jgi:hypothetical protein
VTQPTRTYLCPACGTSTVTLLPGKSWWETCPNGRLLTFPEVSECRCTCPHCLCRGRVCEFRGWAKDYLDYIDRDAEWNGYG